MQYRVGFRHQGRMSHRFHGLQQEYILGLCERNKQHHSQLRTCPLDQGARCQFLYRPLQCLFQRLSSGCDSMQCVDILLIALLRCLEFEHRPKESLDRISQPLRLHRFGPNPRNLLN